MNENMPGGYLMQRSFLLLATALLLAACARLDDGPRSAGAGYDKGAPVVFIHPVANSYREASVGIAPFLMPAAMEPNQGAAVAEIFKDVFLGKRAFVRVAKLNGPCESLEAAVAAGKKSRVDLVAIGQVGQILSGTELGGGRVEISLRLINVQSGNTVWYIQQTMDQPMDYPRVDFLTRVKESFSPPEIRPPGGGSTAANMIVQIAADMADVMAGARHVARN